MKKNLLTVLLVVALLVCSVAFAEVDTSDWTYSVFEDNGIALNLPADFVNVEYHLGEVNYYADDEDMTYMVSVDVDIIDEKYASAQEIYDAYKDNAAVGEIELVNLNGVEAVRIAGADDYVNVLFVPGADGNTYRISVFYNLDEDGGEVAGSEEIANKIIESTMPAENVPVNEDVEGDEWRYYVFEDIGIAMEFPADYNSEEFYVGDMRTYDDEGESTLWLQVTKEDETYDDLQALADAYAQNEVFENVKVENINGVDVVTFEDGEMADGDVKGFFIISDGTVYRFCIYLDMDGEVIPGNDEIADAIMASLIPADQVSAN